MWEGNSITVSDHKPTPNYSKNYFHICIIKNSFMLSCMLALYLNRHEPHRKHSNNVTHSMAYFCTVLVLKGMIGGKEIKDKSTKRDK
jgi:hypothetical protein